MYCNFRPFLPVLLFSVYIALYHCYVIGFTFIDTTLSLVEVILFLLIFHIFYYMLIWCTLATIFQPLPVVPDEFRLSALEIKLYNHSTAEKKSHVLTYFYDKNNLFIITRTAGGNLRFCGLENQFKPDRAHHCSQCGICVLKMDHHCQWLNTCICFTNQKGFILILFYTFLVCLLYVCTSFNMFVSFWTIPNAYSVYYYPAVIGFIIAAVLGTITAIFFMFHLGLILRNRTLIEDVMPAIFLSGRETYNLGTLPNMAEVFGYSVLLWFVPIFNQEGDGTFFPTRRIRRRSDEAAERQKLERNFSDFVR